MRIKIIVAVLLFVPCVVFLSSCSNRSKSNEPNTGEVLDAEFFESVSLSLVSKETEMSKDPDMTMTLPQGAYLDMPVIWCDGNNFWHTYQKCPYFISSATSGSGTLSEAIAVGKTKVCPYCYKIDFSDNDENNNVFEGDDLYDIP